MVRPNSKSGRRGFKTGIVTAPVDSSTLRYCSEPFADPSIRKKRLPHTDEGHGAALLNVRNVLGATAYFTVTSRRIPTRLTITRSAL